MEYPQIQGYQIQAEIGSGSAGVVYLATRDNGSRCAIKAFDSMSSNPGLLADRIQRILEAGAQGAIVPITAQALDARPACIIMDLLTGSAPDESPIESNTLQIAFNQYLKSDSTWPFLQNLASALAKLHSARVAHGNLKPGNIFLGQGGLPLLADFASGLMPGVHCANYSDALLYSPPEQLRSPQDYEGEAGYRWDVYAFGVLAYRLLTGNFPRSNDLFQSVSPPPGENQRFEIDADHEGIARGLEEQPGVYWPEEAADEKEKAFRAIIDSCLQLDPRSRPFNMREVARRFGAIEIELAQKKERERLEFLEKQADKKLRRVSRCFVTTSLIALALAGGWGGTQFLKMQEAKKAKELLADYRVGAEAKVSDLTNQREVALQSQSIAIAAKESAETALVREKSLASDELRSAHGTNEKLFNWILEEGIEGLPVLEGRAARLESLLAEVGKQLKGLSVRAELKEQASILKLRRAELALAMGDVEKGGDWLNEAIDDPKLPPELAARARLRNLLLVSKRKPSELKGLLGRHEAGILDAYQRDDHRRLRAKAALDLVKARLAEATGDGARALAAYLDSLKAFQELEKLYPANSTIGLIVGRRFLTAALAAEGEGSPGNAAKLRGEAAAAFVTLAKKQENPAPEIQYQIASAKAARAVSLWQQGDSFGAEMLAREGVTRLTALQSKMPGDFRVAIDLASQRGIIATALRDEGKLTEAQSLLSKEIAVLGKGVKEYPENWSACYLLTSLKWQLSGLLGRQGSGDEELRLSKEAYHELKALLKNPAMKQPRPSEVRKSLAYLCGDLGHASDLRNKREDAIIYLQECKRYWQELARDKGDQLEIREGYQWAVNRLAEVGVK